MLSLLGVLGLGGCAGVMYLIYRGSDPIAAVGADYVRNQAKIEEAVGNPIHVKRQKLGWNVQVHNDAGNAFFTYTTSGPRGSGKTEVWLTKTGGNWTPQGARFARADGSGGDIEMGSSDYRETIIGEATEVAVKDLVSKLIAAKGRLSE